LTQTAIRRIKGREEDVDIDYTGYRRQEDHEAPRIGQWRGKDFFASIRDSVGCRSQAYEQELQKAKNIALEEMQARADSMGANAIVAVDLDYESIQMGTSNMLMVSASGTAVVYQ